MSAIQELFQMMDQSFILGVIELIDENLGKVKVRYLSIQGGQTLNMPNPWFGGTAWLRAYPAVGSFVLVAKTQVGQEAHIVKVYDQSEQARLLLNFVPGISADPTKQAQGYIPPVDNIAEAQAPPEGLPFRKLRAGELETVSSGRAEWWFSSNGSQIGRSGLVREVFDAKKSVRESLAAAHTLQGLDHSQVENTDMTHFGVVRRALDVNIVKAQQLINVSQITQEIEALLRDNSDQKAVAAKLQAEVEATRKDYESAAAAVQSKAQSLQRVVKLPESYTQLSQLDEPIKTSLQKIQLYHLALEKQELYGSTLGYAQEDFTAGVKDVRLQQVEVESAKTSIEGALPAKDRGQMDMALAVLANQGPREVPKLDLDKVFSTTIQSLEAQKQKVKLTADALLKATSVPKEEVEERHIYKDLLLEQGQFCKEYRVNLSWKGSPTTLYEAVRGHVYSADGLREKSPTTQLPLRSRETFYNDDGKATIIFIDVNGNVSHILSPSATDGYTLTIPKGNARMRIGESLDLTVGKSATVHVSDHLSIQVDKLMEVEAEDIKWKARNSIEMEAPVVRIKAGTMATTTAPMINLSGSSTVVVETPSFIHP
jgi:hypothetical protein